MVGVAAIALVAILWGSEYIELRLLPRPGVFIDHPIHHNLKEYCEYGPHDFGRVQRGELVDIVPIRLTASIASAPLTALASNGIDTVLPT